ncbi:hypothetical protein [Croceivirga sp. JEA036]|uniref:hypothetical protein n=1 Tax=Croceivirga sp. JEA036 TaxID=2721162 RepID=UPI0014396E68|nr:hypothetical protein [Croceivirga sp. JEA036]NJB35910.1 hypothetical protein [Croceivirga sp. JEA036]
MKFLVNLVTAFVFGISLAFGQTNCDMAANFLDDFAADADKLATIAGKPELVDSWNDLYTAGKIHFAKDIAALEKYHKLNPDVRVLLIKLSDDVDPTKSSIANFFSDMDDDLITALNSKPDFAKGVVGHKEGNLMTKDNFTNLAEELDDFDDISSLNKQKLYDAYDRSAGINKFQGFAKLGNDLNKNIKTDLITEAGKFNESGHMGALLKEKFPSKSDWHKYDVFEELPLETTNGFMKGDVVLVKKNDFGQIEDVIVIENKLSKGTDLTVRQTEGFGAVINTSDGLSMKVKYEVVNKKNANTRIDAGVYLTIKKENCLKISDHTTDQINTLSIDDLEFITEFTF